MNDEIGINQELKDLNQRNGISGSSKNPKSQKQFSYMVEDIPQISHQQELFEVINQRGIQYDLNCILEEF